MRATRVVNIRDLPRDPADWPDDHVYIGRANKGRGLPSSRCHNPYKEGPNGERPDVIREFEAELRLSPHRLARLPELRGKTLVCWCAPKGGVTAADRPFICHGQVLAALADEGAS